MAKDRYALLSVTDKSGIAAFAQGLERNGFRILSTGGTSRVLREHGVTVMDVSEYTGHPECLDGRVKTLHPKVHGGLLADRTKAGHVSDMDRLGFEAIDVVAVNLYDFAGQALGKDLPLQKVIEHIDIGGPAMLRAAAKNHHNVYVVVDPADYESVLEALAGRGSEHALKQQLAAKVFSTTAAYDQMIANDLKGRVQVETTSETPALIPKEIKLNLRLVQPLRYGENSHQLAGLYTFSDQAAAGLPAAKILQGKELSYNNLLDLDAASAIVADMDPLPCITIIKHTNPCGTAAGVNLDALTLFRRALASDPKCAFGGIVASNIPVDGPAAAAMSDIFLECVVAPAFTPEALIIFQTKKNVRIMETQVTQRKGRQDPLVWRSVSGGLLAQSPDNPRIEINAWRCVSATQPTPEILQELQFAMTLCRHVKSNAIVLTRDMRSIGIGAGQMSRVDSANIAVDKARELDHSPCGAVAASDAFFPFRDSVDIIAKAGITAIVQPGGSVRDQESIEAANEHGIVMMLTGVRHFKH